MLTIGPAPAAERNFSQFVRSTEEVKKMKLHPQAQQVCDLIVASGRPPIETLTPTAGAPGLPGRRAPILQPDPEPVAEVLALPGDGPAGPIPLRLLSRQRASTKAGRSRRSSTSMAAAG